MLIGSPVTTTPQIKVHAVERLAMKHLDNLAISCSKRTRSRAVASVVARGAEIAPVTAAAERKQRQYSCGDSWTGSGHPRLGGCLGGGDGIARFFLSRGGRCNQRNLRQPDTAAAPR